MGDNAHTFWLNHYNENSRHRKVYSKHFNFKIIWISTIYALESFLLWKIVLFLVLIFFLQRAHISTRNIFYFNFGANLKTL